MNGKTLSTIAFMLGMLGVVFMMLMLLPALLHAGSGTFSAGNARLSIVFGGAVAFDRNYSILGMGGGYFIADGIEVGLDAEAWSGNSPRIEQVSPQARVVLWRDGSVQPYAGIFYRRTLIDGYRDLDTAGARAGVYFLSGRNAYFGAGLAEEVHLNCDRTVYTYCMETYPELLFAVIF
jgi:hypothetical protein